VFDNLVDWLAGIWCRIGRVIARLLYRFKYNSRDWRYDAAGKRWFLRETEGPDDNDGAGPGRKRYTCAEFVRAKLDAPLNGPVAPREPKWGVNSGEWVIDDIVANLTGRGFAADGCRCGCCRGEHRQCGVVFSAQGAIDHVAIFDPQTCDWVGKQSGVQRERFIERWLDPQDLVDHVQRRTGVTLTYTLYCKPGAPAGYRSDHDLHDAARKV
jgi:hypothetical protein